MVIRLNTVSDTCHIFSSKKQVFTFIFLKAKYIIKDNLHFVLTVSIVYFTISSTLKWTETSLSPWCLTC